MSALGRLLRWGGIILSVAALNGLQACQDRAAGSGQVQTVSPAVQLGERQSGYAGSPDDWVAFLSCWHEAARDRHEEKARQQPDKPYAPIVRQDPRTTDQLQSRESMIAAIERLEVSLGVSLPKSYKDFLLAYRPPPYKPQIVGAVAFNIGIYAPSQVGRYGKLEPQLVAEEEKWWIHSSDADYFTYGIPQDDVSGRTSYHRDAIVVGKYGDSRYEVIVLYPQVRTADREMEAALFYHSGEFRAPSFAELMRQLSILEIKDIDHMPPYPQSILRGTCADKLSMVNVWWE